MLKKLFLNTLLVSIFALPVYSITHAQDAAPAELGAIEKPLVVIRFTDKVVPYEGALTRAVSQAERQMDAPFYDVISIQPKENSFFGNSDNGANVRTRHVTQSIQQAGVPENRIRLTQEQNISATYHEIHVFVR